MKKTRIALLVTLAGLALAISPVAAQEGFGFGEPETQTTGAESGAARAVTVGGEVEAGALSFVATGDDGTDMPTSGIATGHLDITAKGSSAESVIKLKVSREILAGSPADLLDEAYVRLFMGSTTVEGGLMKIVWGKADSQGPLDVLNPYDLSDLTVTDTLDRKIARPMVHVAIALGDFSKLEFAGLPGFEGHRIAWDGYWEPSQIAELKGSVESFFAYYNALSGGNETIDTEDEEAMVSYPDTETFAYSQAGLRFTTTLGAVDLGAQYFYGYLPTPVVAADAAALGALYSSGTPIPVVYNRYHQVGADCASVIAGFNLRAEMAANITEDLEGDDPEIYNPHLAWSLGFDRDLFANINLNVQGSGTYRLFEDGVGSSPYDIEGGTERAKTRITAYLSQKLFKDRLEWELKGIVGIEDRDYLLIPSVSYAVGDGRIELEAGIFGGEEDGELGQYADSSYVRAFLSYRF